MSLRRYHTGNQNKKMEPKNPDKILFFLIGYFLRLPLTTNDGYYNYLLVISTITHYHNNYVDTFFLLITLII